MAAHKVDSLIAKGAFDCECGTRHVIELERLVMHQGALSELGTLIKEYGYTHVYLLADRTTHSIAGARIETICEAHGITCTTHAYDRDGLEPDEKAVGEAILHFPPSCDLVLGVGSGTVNDIGKVVAHVTGRHYWIAATAPSMDGYASSSSSMVRGQLKTTIHTLCPQVIIADTAILREAPDALLTAGVGDMASKYISLLEWKVSLLVNGEYHCPVVAQLMAEALERCMSAAPRILEREAHTIEAVFEGLVIAGIAATYAQVSRPASGVEHYVSHLQDMHAIEHGYHPHLHGHQVSVGTVFAMKLWRAIASMELPDEEQAIHEYHAIDLDTWFAQLEQWFGMGGEVMGRQARAEQRYDPIAHRQRLANILLHWNEIVALVDTMLPNTETLVAMMEGIGLPTTFNALGVEHDLAHIICRATKEVRAKYIGTTLLTDIGCDIPFTTQEWAALLG